MQKIFITCLILMTSFLSHARPGASVHYQSELNAFLNGALQTNNFIFHTLIATRCHRYTPQPDVAACYQAVSEMIAILDTDIILPGTATSTASVVLVPDAFLFVAFKNNLIQLLSHPRTTLYLDHLKSELNNYLTRESDHFNLWETTLKFYGANEKAAQVIAILLQDTSPSMLHLSYLQNIGVEGNQHFKDNKENLRATIEILNMVLSLRVKDYLKLLYPSDVKESLNKNLYHFYVPYFLSMALKKTKVKKPMIYVAPMLMTLTYEFITTAADYRYVFKDPKTLSPGQHGWKIKDILAGHIGAGRGSQKKTLKTLKFLNTSFSLSTEKTVKALLAP